MAEITHIGDILPDVLSRTAKRSDAWKTLERNAARSLGGRRVTVPWELFQTRPDVTLEIDDLPAFAECKLRQRFEHHRLYGAAKEKYAKAGEETILVTHIPHGETLATVRLDFLADLLRTAREANAL